MKFRLRIYYRGGFPNNFPYLFHLDKNDYPTTFFEFKAKNEVDACEKLSTLEGCQKLKIPDYAYFLPYKLVEVK